jgi:agmatine deiminase
MNLPNKSHWHLTWRPDSFRALRRPFWDTVLACRLRASIMTDLRLVPDWAPHSYCWMAWAIDPSEWGKDAGGARQELREVITTISRFEKVRLLTPRNLLSDARAQHFGSDVEIVEAPVDDIWMRDIAPVYALRKGEPICIDLNFNGWGSTSLRRARPGDRLAGLARSLFASTMLNAPFVA